MNQKMPKVAADMDHSLVGKRMHEMNESSRDKISEDPELTAWRRSLRAKFNTEQGAEIARANSLVLAEQRAEERRVRKAASGSAAAASRREVVAPADAAEPAAAAAPVDAAAEAVREPQAAPASVADK